MADNKFLQGPGGRLQRAQADATRVAKKPIDPIVLGKMLPEVEIIAPVNARNKKQIGDISPRNFGIAEADATRVYRNPSPKIMAPEIMAPVDKKSPKQIADILPKDWKKAKVDETRVYRDPRPKGPYIVMHDKVDYTNPSDYKLGVVQGLKKANTMLGGDIERGGYDRESFSDVINRLEQTPGTAQYAFKNAPEIPNIPLPIAAPANAAISAFNWVRPKANRIAAATGEVLLDPVNYAGGMAARGTRYGLNLASQMANMPASAAQTLRFLGNAAPWLDRGNDVVEATTQYIDYPKKPKFEQKERKTLSPQQQEFLQKISKYNFGSVK